MGPDRNDAGTDENRLPCFGPIAICSIELRLPGGIYDGEDFLGLLVSGGDARTEIPTSRYAIQGFDASRKDHPRYGYSLGNDMRHSSPCPRPLERCDPQQLQLLEVGRECFEDAGEVNYGGQAVRCYVGTFNQD
ncbi:hypothetical protein F4678DRAFT_288012 [Xylaria arbuscula]|nr:hypothetical protein F4678DRAFT_288012 [Xylaria arbuscula]